MSAKLIHTSFHEIFFPAQLPTQVKDHGPLTLNQVHHFRIAPQTNISQVPIIVFDFETTGFDSQSDRIIEIGGIKYFPNGKVEEFSSLINPERNLPQRITEITGLTDDQLIDKPKIQNIIPSFLDFIRGGVLVAHNADFDYAFLKANCTRLGYEIEWPCFCTLKISRNFLADLPNRTLDTLAQHYGLTFEARHRSIGDCKVTLAVLQAMLKNEAKALLHWEDFASYQTV